MYFYLILKNDEKSRLAFNFLKYFFNQKINLLFFLLLLITIIDNFKFEFI